MVVVLLNDSFSLGFVLSLALMVGIVLQKASFVCFLSAFV